MNYIPKIAKMLGVEMLEHFYLVNGDGKKIDGRFCFDDNGLKKDNTHELYYSAFLEKLLNGKYTIKKLPWKPEKGDSYFMPGIFGGIAVVEDAIWNENEGDEEIDELHYDGGLVCRTREEAMAKAKKMLAAAQEVNVNDD